MFHVRTRMSLPLPPDPAGPEPHLGPSGQALLARSGPARSCTCDRIFSSVPFFFLGHIVFFPCHPGFSPYVRKNSSTKERFSTKEKLIYCIEATFSVNVTKLGCHWVGAVAWKRKHECCSDQMLLSEWKSCECCWVNAALMWLLACCMWLRKCSLRISRLLEVGTSVQKYIEPIIAWK